ncbi:hypothetical protein IY73_00385 [Lawsonella clevelandensis]|uniref:Uncharacterized protein n=1 Tax=Lawsonella clevelandensis TaxID=1528099 RepID=A0A0M3TB84_9ACTN|nr:hypothetical protein AL705_00370 [Lawsonella clevelandensis]ALE34089.1 hypothetical protein IY73_00385 [Lawsonella clevelandensis]
MRNACCTSERVALQGLFRIPRGSYPRQASLQLCAFWLKIMGPAVSDTLTHRDANHPSCRKKISAFSFSTVSQHIPRMWIRRSWICENIIAVIKEKHGVKVR